MTKAVSGGGGESAGLAKEERRTVATERGDQLILYLLILRRPGGPCLVADPGARSNAGTPQCFCKAAKAFQTPSHALNITEREVMDFVDKVACLVAFGWLVLKWSSF